MSASFYTVYDNRSDEILFTGSAQECAKHMGIKLSSFYYAISRQKSGRIKHPRLFIYKERDNSEDQGYQTT